MSAAPSSLREGDDPAGDDVARDAYLLTPGPITTSFATKAAMLHDWGSRDPAFIDMTRRVRRRLLELVRAERDHVCVPIQGSGTFAIEATIGTLVPPQGKVLILVNGVYGRRMKQICEYYGRSHRVLETAEHVPADPAALNSVLADDPEVTHVAAVHCETTSGILNPIGEIAKVVAGQRRSLIIDAMSTFGAIDIDADEVPFDALVASANKCLEGLPGLGFAIVRREKLERSKGNAPSLSLDLYEQWRGLEDNGQWRFTPPTHVIAALDHALTELEEEGGVTARGARYGQNSRILLDGLQDMGFVSALDEDVQAPIILTWLNPADPRFDFQVFYQSLSRRGFLIYPGKLTLAETFRIGCIGRLGETEMRATLDAVRSTIEEMGVTDCSPKVR